jgi:hypothetical protein
MDPWLEVEKMDAFKTYSDGSVKWIDFIRTYQGVNIEDTAKEVRLTYGGEVCSVKFVGSYYLIAWPSKPVFKSKSLAEIWTQLMRDFVMDHPSSSGRGQPPPYTPARGLPPAYSASDPNYVRAEFMQQEYNNSHVIGLLYELRDMYRSMHDGARTLR